MDVGITVAVGSKTLGPFPKTVKWAEIVTSTLGSDAPLHLADDLLKEVANAYALLEKDPAALRAVTFLVALPVCTRDVNPAAAMRDSYGIQVSEDGDEAGLQAALDHFVPGRSLVKVAVSTTIAEFLAGRASDPLLPTDFWHSWREVDGVAFCDLTRRLFAHLNELYFREALLQTIGRVADPAELSRFALEMSLITRTFSARWFNACARERVPELGSIRWYLGHCLGKLDLEISRERSDWHEPTGNPWKRKKQVQADLGL